MKKHMHACIYVCACLCMYVFVCLHVYVCMYSQHVCVYACCLCVCVCVCARAHVPVPIHTYMHACMHAYVRMYVRTHIHIHTHIHTYIITHINTYIHKHILKYTYIHTHTRTYIHTNCIHPCIHTHIHTCTHTHNNTQGRGGGVTSVAFSYSSTFVAAILRGNSMEMTRVSDALTTTQITCANVIVLSEAHFTAVSFSPDDTWILTSCSDRNLRLWDASTQSLVKVLRGHDTQIADMMWACDGAYIASCCRSSVCVWWVGEKVILTHISINIHILL
jgi:hypothetical protein